MPLFLKNVKSFSKLHVKLIFLFFLPFWNLFDAFLQFAETLQIIFSSVITSFFSIFFHFFISFHIDILIEYFFYITVFFIVLLLIFSKLLLIKFVKTLISNLPLTLFLVLLFYYDQQLVSFLIWRIELQIIKFLNSLLCGMNTRIVNKSMLKKWTCAFEFTNSHIPLLKARFGVL